MCSGGLADLTVNLTRDINSTMTFSPAFHGSDQARGPAERLPGYGGAVDVAGVTAEVSSCDPAPTSTIDGSTEDATEVDSEDGLAVDNQAGPAEAAVAGPAGPTLAEADLAGNGGAAVGEGGEAAEADPALDESAEYNSFEYWRVPLPELDLSDLADAGVDTSGVMGALEAEGPRAESTPDVPDMPPLTAETPSSAALSPAVNATTTTPGPAVPAVLVEHFNRMARASSTKTVDTDVVRECAFSFPAILWALGTEGWPDVRDTYNTLASNDDWRVRATIAHSIHVCAKILGPGITEKELMSKFGTFLKDWDEVRVGAIKHFADFVGAVSPELRGPYLKMLLVLKDTDDANNWRYRQLLVDQAGRLAEMCSLADTAAYVCPVAMFMAENDGVASVRNMALRALATLASRMLASSGADDGVRFCRDIVTKFQQSNRSLRRQG